MHPFNIRRRTVLGLLAALSCSVGQAHAHGGHAASAARDLGSAAAFDREGRLWAVIKQADDSGQYLALQHSDDLGSSWSTPRRLQQSPEPIAASGEARPHIAIGRKGEIYISYTSTIARPHIGNIRFMRLLDGGKTFSDPITVHANRDHVTHSFESIAVDAQGRIFVAWIDGRDAAAAKKQDKRYAGSAVYYAVSHDRGASFGGDIKLADHACECCRIGLSLDHEGRAVAMWRHIFDTNTRDHALSVLDPKGQTPAIERVTFDDWRIDACPHHGPSLAYAPDGTRHQVWFTGKQDAGGAFYALAAAGGKPSTPVALGSPQASHPDIAVAGKRIAITWKQFDGKQTAVLVRWSADGGKTWTQKEAANTAGASDNPYLILAPSGIAPSGIVLVWRTQAEGIRVIPLQA